MPGASGAKPFPYTTLFRSAQPVPDGRQLARDEGVHDSIRLRAMEIEPVRERRSQHGREPAVARSEEHTSELQSRLHLVCRPLLAKKKGRRPGAGDVAGDAA